MNFSIRILFILSLLASFATIGCHHDHDHDDHVDAFGFTLSVNGEEFFRIHLSSITGSINVPQGTTTDEIEIHFLSENGQTMFQPEDSKYRLVVQTEQASIISITEPSESARWKFRLTGVAIGSTRLRFNVNHGNHSDYVSAWVDASVSAAETVEAQ